MSTEPYDEWLDRAQGGLIRSPEARAIWRRGDRRVDIGHRTPAELRAMVALLWARLQELAPDASPETLREVEDDELAVQVARLERRIGKAMGK